MTSAMNYTLEHLKIVYNAGAKKFPFDQALELISLLGEEGLSGLLAKPPATAKVAGSSPAATPKAQPGPKTVRRAKGGKRGELLSTRILHFLYNKGTMGAHVKDIAESINAPQASVNTWFYSGGRKLIGTGEIKKVAPATFSCSPAAKTE
jgi:hypothetical protein